MKHTRLGYTASRRTALPPLSGGMDTSRPAHLIRDDQVCEAHNVWWRDGMLRTRPALRAVSADVGLGMPRVTSFNDSAILYANAGNKHRLAVLRADGTLHGVTVTDSTVSGIVAVSADNAAAVLYFRGSGAVWRLSDDGTLTEAAPTIPCVLSAGRATKTKRREESGALIQPVNLLTPAYTCRYTTDGEGIYYWLPEAVNVRFDAPLTIAYTTAAGVRHTHTVPPATDVRRETGSSTDDLLAVYEPSVKCFYFTDKDKKPVALPMADVADNLTLSSECVRSERFSRIGKMTVGTVFGGRVFLGGDTTAPHRVQWSAVNDPLYFPENNFASVGEADDRVTAFGRQGEALVILKEHSVYVATEHRETITATDVQSGAVADTETGVYFPLVQVHSEVGCPYPATVRLCGDRLVWMAGDARVYTLFTGGTYDAKRVRPLSRPVEPLGTKAVSAVRYGERYVLLSGADAVVLEYTDGVPATAEDAVWHRWQFPYALTAADVGGHTYLIRVAEDGAWQVVTLAEGVGQDEGDCPIAVKIATKQYELGAPERYKQLRSVTVWMQGEATLTVTDGDRAVATARLRDQAGAPQCVLVPTSRVMRCGFVWEATGQIAIDRVQAVHRRMGEIRE